MFQNLFNLFNKDKRSTYKVFVIINIIIRLLVGPLILISVWYASIISFFFDWIDGELFKRAGIKRTIYSYSDKILDYYWYLAVIYYIYLASVPNKEIYLLLFIYRSVGQFWFFFSKNEKILIFFPNIFEILFYFYLFSTKFVILRPVVNSSQIYLLIALLTPIKLVREYFLHIENANLSWFFTGKTTYRIDDKFSKRF